MLLLGLNAYHGDSAACLVRDGQLVAAAEEERFRRIKHWAGLPTQAIDYCLREAGVKISDIHHIAINRKPGVNNFRRARFLLTHRPDPRLVFAKLRNIGKAATVESALGKVYGATNLMAQAHHIEHHHAHLASAFLVSPFDEAVCVSVDGFGDFASAAWGMGQGNDIRIDGRVYFPHSLGVFYSAITQFIGFPHFGDEYKVMGLAPYGEPKHLAQMREIVRIQRDGTYRLNLDCFRHHKDNVSYTWNDCTPEVGTLYRREALEELLGPERKKGEPLEQHHKDLARSAQAIYEEAFFALLNALHAKYQCSNLALSGGCAMNSVANGKVYLRSPFKKMYLPAAAGDAGGAIGSAFTVWHSVGTHSTASHLPPTSGAGSTGDSPVPLGNLPKDPFPPDVSISASQRFGISESSPTGSTGASPVLAGDSPGSSYPGISSFQRFSISRRSPALMDAYSGPEFSDAEIETVLISRSLLPSPPRAGRGKEGEVSNSVSPSHSISAFQPFSLSAFSPTGSAPTSDLRPLTTDVGITGASPVLAGDSLGSSCSNISAFQRFSVSAFSSFAALARTTAQAIADGKVIGWFQGRMEWGPRALGNRSILGDPRRTDMKDILNSKIKRRESFRPFAPSILREHVSEWFEQDDDVPFMMQVFQVRAEKRSQLPAVCHVDGLGGFKPSTAKPTRVITN